MYSISRGFRFGAMLGAASLSIGCGAGSDPTDAPTLNHEWQFISQTYPFLGTHGENVCAEWRRLDDAGHVQVEREYYHFSLINEALAGRNDVDPRAIEAVKSSGLQAVRTCDDARAFMKRKSDYLESLPTTDDEPIEPPLGVLPKTEAPTLSAGVPAGGEAPAAGDEVDKIAEGYQWYQSYTVRVRHDGYTCSGILINGRALLTSAHCFPGDGYYSVSVDYGDAWLPTQYCISSNYPDCNNPPPYNMTVYRYPGYLGDSDTERDLALVISPTYWAWPADTDASWMRLVYSHPTAAVSFWSLGYGVDMDANHGAGIGRVATRSDIIDWSSADYWLAHVNQGYGRPCRGDSGSPADNTDLIGHDLAVGVFSNFDYSGAGYCPGPDDKYRYTKISNKLQWILPQIGPCDYYIVNGWAYYWCY